MRYYEETNIFIRYYEENNYFIRIYEENKYFNTFLRGKYIFLYVITSKINIGIGLSDGNI